MSRAYIIGTIVLSVMLFACTDSFDSPRELNQWINSPENGMVAVKQSGDKELVLKYLPASYLVYKEIKDIKEPTKGLVDSLMKVYANSRSFLLTIKYKGDEPYDPVYEGIADFYDFKERKEDMQFSFDKYVKLCTSQGNEYKPVLSHMEDTYGLQKHRNIYLVFAPETESESDIMGAGELDVVFHDKIFDTGITHFVFKKKDIDKELKLNFLK